MEGQRGQLIGIQQPVPDWFRDFSKAPIALEELQQQRIGLFLYFFIHQLVSNL